MKRTIVKKRPDWKEHATESGFDLHEMYGCAYWNEGAVYEFTLHQIENDLEDPSTELHGMCLDALDDIVRSEQLMTKMGIPAIFQENIYDSYVTRGDMSLYGRFDLAYNGRGPAKLLEYNGDTPTSLYESAYYQWVWMEECKKMGILSSSVDQFNTIEERMIDAFRLYFSGQEMYFATAKHFQEDFMTVQYMAMLAYDGGVNTKFIHVEDIGIADDADKKPFFCTPSGEHIQTAFKLYPWENMFKDDYGQEIVRCDTQWVEPIWKSLISNKALLPVLWQKYPNHPNLLEAYFESDVDYRLTFGDRRYVRKPFFSMEGHNIELMQRGETYLQSDGNDFDSPLKVLQEYVHLPNFEGNYPIIGTWIVDDVCCGMGIREDDSKITQKLSRFTPHIIID